MPDLTDPWVILYVFLVASSVVGFLLLKFQRKESVESRLNQFSHRPSETETEKPKQKKKQTQTQAEDDQQLFEELEPKSFSAMIFPFRNKQVRQKMAERLIQAGIYQRDSAKSYAAIQSVMILVPAGLALIVYSSGLASFQTTMMVAVGTGLAGLIAPGFYLDSERGKRQANLRKAMPDALDVIIICVEGGLSVPASFARVAIELATVHPLLSIELTIVQREIQMGHTTGEAIKSFAKRFDMDELRSLASVILQAEKFGSSVVSALRTHADGLREKRMMRAEELAAQASVKIMIPTVFCIFPSLFVVILSPAVFDIMEVFGGMNTK